jgi:hypothetical protein
MMFTRSGLTLIIVVAPRSLDRAFQRLGTGIGEEHLVGKGRIAQPLGELFARHRSGRGWRCAQLVGLALDSLHQMRVGMAERIDRDAGNKIHVAASILIEQPDALAAHKGLRRAFVCPIKRVVGRVG